MNKEIDDKMNEIDHWQSQNATLEKKKVVEIEDLNYLHENEKKSSIERELNLQGIKNDADKNQIENKYQEQKQKAIDFESRLNYMNLEVERLNKHLNERVKDIEVAKTEYAQLQISKDREIQDLEDQCETLKRQVMVLLVFSYYINTSFKINEDQSIRFDAERSAKETEIMQLKEKESHLESQIVEFQKQIAELNANHSEKVYEYEQLRSKIKNVEGEYSDELDDLQKEIEYYKRLNIVNNLSLYNLI